MNLRPLNWLKNRQRPKDGSDISEELKQQILSQDFSINIGVSPSGKALDFDSSIIGSNPVTPAN